MLSDLHQVVIGADYSHGLKLDDEYMPRAQRMTSRMFRNMNQGVLVEWNGERTGACCTSDSETVINWTIDVTRPT